MLLSYEELFLKIPVSLSAPVTTALIAALVKFRLADISAVTAAVVVIGMLVFNKCHAPGTCLRLRTLFPIAGPAVALILLAVRGTCSDGNFPTGRGATRTITACDMADSITFESPADRSTCSACAVPCSTAVHMTTTTRGTTLESRDPPTWVAAIEHAHCHGLHRSTHAAHHAHGSHAIHVHVTIPAAAAAVVHIYSATTTRTHAPSRASSPISAPRCLHRSPIRVECTPPWSTTTTCTSAETTRGGMPTARSHPTAPQSRLLRAVSIAQHHDSASPIHLWSAAKRSSESRLPSNFEMR